MAGVAIIPVNLDNVAKTGFFCKISAHGKPGYEQKLHWLKDRFAEGLQMRLLSNGARGNPLFLAADRRPVDPSQVLRTPRGVQSFAMIAAGTENRRGKCHGIRSSPPRARCRTLDAGFVR